jgi:hypothetical protein
MGNHSVREVIERGLKEVERPGDIIILVSLILSAVLVYSFSWWCLLLIPIGAVIATQYAIFATEKWKYWAYHNVNDLHQFQRSGELAGLLKIGSFETLPQELHEMFANAPDFVDDPKIPGELLFGTPPFSRKTIDAIVIINERGVHLPEDFFEWEYITHERVAHVSYRRKRGDGTETGGTRKNFRFQYGNRHLEIPLSELNTTAWKLDLALYIYRGRHSLNKAMAN